MEFFKFKLPGTPDQIATLALALRSGNYVAKVEVSQIYKRAEHHQRGYAWITVHFSSTVTNDAPVEIYERKRRTVNGKRARDGYVYLLLVGEESKSKVGPDYRGLYKIGKTTNPKSRRKTFGVKLPFAVAYEHVIHTDDMARLESALHRRFANYRQRGSEFFMLTGAHINWIKALGEEYSAALAASW